MDSEEKEKMYMTVEDAAVQANKSREAIYKAIRRGYILSQKFGVAVMVIRSSFEAWLNDPEKHKRGGNKKKPK